MEFWGVEVKPGEPFPVDFESDELESTSCIHLSQAALGESKKDKGSEPVVLYLTVAGQKFVLGTLIKDKLPQIPFDVLIEQNFELSHNWKNGSVFFMGYKQQLEEDDDDLLDVDIKDEDIPLMTKENGKPDAETEVVKAAAPKNDVKASGSEKQVKVVDPKKNEEEDSEEDEDDESDDEEDGSGSDEDMLKANSDSDSEDDGGSDSDEDDEETPPAKGKKRPNDSAAKTPASAKKAKTITPQKTGGHSATPHPSKKAAGKTPNSQAKVQTPKSGGQLSCKSCSKTFTSEAGLQQHSKVKHGGQ